MHVPKHYHVTGRVLNSTNELLKAVFADAVDLLNIE